LKILITGGNGFVGQNLDCFFQKHSQHSIVCAARSPQSTSSGFLSLDLDSDFNISAQLADVDVIVHCAARVHLMQDNASNPLAEYRRVNTTGTIELARQAADAGVRRFIFISTIKVNGESTPCDIPFQAAVARPPEDPYALSKYEAEQGLLALAKESGMEVVIIRPPLVYGLGVKANFNSMMNCVKKGLPLPLGAIENRRSLVYVGNLVDLIVTCLDHPGAVNRTLLVSDDEDVSTTQLLKKIADAMGRKSRLLPIPSKYLLLLTKVLGKAAVGERLCSSLHVDISETKSCLQWTPPYTLDEALKLTVRSKK